MTEAPFEFLRLSDNRIRLNIRTGDVSIRRDFDPTSEVEIEGVVELLTRHLPRTDFNLWLAEVRG